MSCSVRGGDLLCEGLCQYCEQDITPYTDVDAANYRELIGLRARVRELAITGIEWGVRFPDGTVNVHSSQNDALIEAGDYGGDVVTRTVSAWVKQS